MPEGRLIEGAAQVLYNHWLVPGWIKFGMAVHIYGFGVATLACWQALKVWGWRLAADARPGGHVGPWLALARGP